jgi:hypothetical protein
MRESGIDEKGERETERKRDLAKIVEQRGSGVGESFVCLERVCVR